MLNSDCAFLVFDQLSLRDVCNCTLINRAWRTLAHKWITSYGAGRALRIVYGPTDDDDARKIKDFKDAVRLEKSLRAARPPLSIVYPPSYPEPGLVGRAGNPLRHKLPLPCVLFAGHYAAWAERGSLFWHTIPPASTRQKIGVPGFSDAWASIHGLNAEGYLLARVKDRGHNSAWATRDVVIHLPTGEVVWNLDYSSSSPGMSPVAIGEDRAYFWTGDAGPDRSNNIVAHDFRTGHLLYHRPISMPKRGWAPYCDSPHASAYISNRFRVFQCGGYEFLIRDFYKPGSVHVLDGSSGRQVLHLEFPELYVTSVVVAPEHSVFTVHAQLRSGFQSLLQQYRLQPDGSFSRVTTDLYANQRESSYFVPHPFAALTFANLYSSVCCESTRSPAFDSSLFGEQIDRRIELVPDDPHFHVLRWYFGYTHEPDPAWNGSLRDLEPSWNAVFIDLWRMECLSTHIKIYSLTLPPGLTMKSVSQSI